MLSKDTPPKMKKGKVTSINLKFISQLLWGRISSYMYKNAVKLSRESYKKDLLFVELKITG